MSKKSSSNKSARQQQQSTRSASATTSPKQRARNRTRTNVQAPTSTPDATIAPDLVSPVAETAATSPAITLDDVVSASATTQASADVATNANDASISESEALAAATIADQHIADALKDTTRATPASDAPKANKQRVTYHYALADLTRYWQSDIEWRRRDKIEKPRAAKNLPPLDYDLGIFAALMTNKRISGNDPATPIVASVKSFIDTMMSTRANDCAPFVKSWLPTPKASRVASTRNTNATGSIDPVAVAIADAQSRAALMIESTGLKQSRKNAARMLADAEKKHPDDALTIASYRAMVEYIDRKSADAAEAAAAESAAA
jgi:hypothetical protein